MTWILVLLAAGLGVSLAVVWSRERRRANRMQERFEQLSKTTRDLVWAIDVEGRWTHVNEAAREIYGHTPAAMLGRSFTEFVVSDFAEQDRRFVERAIECREPVQYETTHHNRDGVRVQLVFQAVGTPDGAVGTATDVTHLRELERRLVQTERMYAVGAMAAGVAHDFKNLLTVMVGQAEIARSHATPEVARRLDTILDTAERGRAMVEELLVYARRQNLRHDIIDLVAVVRRMQEMLQRMLRPGVVLQIRAPAAPVYVRAERPKIEQVVMNLVANAHDATTEDGEVIIRVDDGMLSRERTSKLGITPGHWAVLQVIDRGEGMSPEVLDRVFEPFYTTKAEGKGTGLGLATVHGIIHQMGGAVSARSEPGRGTRMSVLLPYVSVEEIDQETTDSVKIPSGA